MEEDKSRDDKSRKENDRGRNKGQWILQEERSATDDRH